MVLRITIIISVGQAILLRITTLYTTRTGYGITHHYPL